MTRSQLAPLAPLCLALAALVTVVRPAVQAAPAVEPILPSAVGNQWIYAAGPLEITERIAGVDKIHGENCLRIETLVQGNVAAHEHVAMRKDGLYRTAIAGEPVVPPLCFLKHPAAAGQHWDVRSKIKETEIAGRFTAGVEPIETPAGAYQAISSHGKDFQSAAGLLTLSYYFVPGVGKVKQSISVDGRKGDLVLKEFRPAQ